MYSIACRARVQHIECCVTLNGDLEGSDPKWKEPGILYHKQVGVNITSWSSIFPSKSLTDSSIHSSVISSYYILSLVSSFGDRKIKKKGSLQSQTHSLAGEEDKAVNYKQILWIWWPSSTLHSIMEEQNLALGGKVWKQELGSVGTESWRANGT